MDPVGILLILISYPVWSQFRKNRDFVTRLSAIVNPSMGGFIFIKVKNNVGYKILRFYYYLEVKKMLVKHNHVMFTF